MIRFVVSLLIIIVVSILQSSLGTLIIGIIRPDIALIVLVFITFRSREVQGQIYGVTCGFIQDMVTLSPIGFHAFTMTVIAFIYSKLRHKAFVTPLVESLILVGTATIMKYIIMISIIVIFGIDNVLENFFAWETLGAIGTTILTSVPIFFLLYRIPLLQNPETTRYYYHAK